MCLPGGGREGGRRTHDDYWRDGASVPHQARVVLYPLPAHSRARTEGARRQAQGR